MNEKNLKLLDTLEGYIDGLLIGRMDRGYDQVHINHVKEYAIRLAKIRNLDVFTAEVMALLHDLGRIHPESSGLKHALEGAERSAILLEGYGVELSRSALICDGIASHSKKKRIQGPYHELIKDADALAHKIEGFDLGWYEEIRCHYAFDLKPTCEWTYSTSLAGAGKMAIAKLTACFNDLEDGKITHEWVHDIRVAIRQIRVLCWLLGNSGQEVHVKKLEGVERVFKSIFKDFEQAREGYIYYEFVKPYIKKNQVKCLKETLKIQYKKLYKKYRGFSLYDKFPSEIQDFYLLLDNIRRPQISASFVLDRYFNQLKRTSHRDSNSLHRLRICGKTLKYLRGLDIVVFDDDIYSQIKVLHDALGRIHDLSLNRTIADKKRMTRRLSKALDRQEKLLMKETKRLLFQMKIKTKSY